MPEPRRATSRSPKRATSKAADRSGRKRPAGRAEPAAVTEVQQPVEQLVAALAEQIASGELPVGGWIRQEKLASEFGVSRTPVREALRQLQTMGAVEMIANRGARVRLPSQRDVAEVYELHALMFGQAAALAAQLITAEEIERMQVACRQFHEIVEDLQAQPRGSTVNFGPRWYRANLEFYNVIIEASGNRNLAVIVDRLHHVIPRNLTWLSLRNDSRRIARDAADHDAILEAIDAGDSEKARTLVMKRTKRAAEMVARVLADTEDSLGLSY